MHPPSSNLLRNSYGYQIPDPPVLHSPTSRGFPSHQPQLSPQEFIRQQESKLEGMESMVRKKYSQADQMPRQLAPEEPLSEQLLRGSCQNVIRKFDYSTLRNTTHFNPMAKFPTNSAHNELRRSPGGEDPNKATINRTLAQEPGNAFLRPNQKKLLQNKHSFLANHQAKTPPKLQIEKPPRTPTKYKTIFQNSTKTSTTNPKSPEEEKKLFKSLNEIAQSKQKEKHSPEGRGQPKRSRMLNGFQLGNTLGKGKFGEVFLGRHHETGFIAALKKTEKQRIKQFKMLDQFTKEIRLHSSLDHPNIVKFYGAFQDGEQVYLVLQYLNGGTLFDYLNQVTVLPLREAVQYLRDVIQALTYLHDRSIAHRDIKPQNIVISSQGVAKLCDFGWSALVQTSRKTYCGTFDYAPPEILQRKNYDTSVDIWCIGVLTYELLTGRVPFQGDKRNIVMEKIVKVQLDLFKLIGIAQIIQLMFELLESSYRHQSRKTQNQKPKCHDLLKFRLFTQHLAKNVEPKKAQ